MLYTTGVIGLPIFPFLSTHAVQYVDSSYWVPTEVLIAPPKTIMSPPHAMAYHSPSGLTQVPPCLALQLMTIDSSLYPIFLGLFAAIAWGLADFLVAYAGSRLSDYPTLTTFAFTQPLGVIAIFLISPFLPIELELQALFSQFLLLISVVGAVSYILLYKALARGPVSITSPIASTYGAIAAILAILLTAESFSWLGTLAFCSIVIGVTLVSTHDPPDRSSTATRRNAIPGTVIAVGAALGLGLTLFSLDFVDVEINLLTAVLVMRIIGTFIALPILWQVDWSVNRGVLPPLVLIGIFDAAAFVFYVQGIRVGRVSIVAPLGSLFAVVTVFLSVLVFKERLSTVQWVGVVSILFGVPIMTLI